MLDPVGAVRIYGPMMEHLCYLIFKLISKLLSSSVSHNGLDELGHIGAKATYNQNGLSRRLLQLIITQFQSEQLLNVSRLGGNLMGLPRIAIILNDIGKL